MEREIPFYKNDDFPAFVQLQSQWLSIRDELMNAIPKGISFSPERNDLLAPGSSWSQFELYIWGLPIPTNLELAPLTANSLSTIPNLLQAAVYVLGPNSHILPHRGNDPKRLRAHLGLECPEGCFLRVDTRTEQERNGGLLIFDDSFDHEARNNSPSGTRYVLHFDFGKPWLPAIGADDLKAYRHAMARNHPEFVARAVLAGMALDTEIRDKIKVREYPIPERSALDEESWTAYARWLNQDL